MTLHKETEVWEVVRETWFILTFLDSPKGACSFWVNDLKLDSVGPGNSEETLKQSGKWRLDQFIKHSEMTSEGEAGCPGTSRGQGLILPS